jgi:FkbM family methyltransferase
MPQHHKIFSRFKPFDGPCPAGQRIHGFLGTKVRPEFFAGMQRSPPPVSTPSRVQAPYPGFNEEYFEWIDLLKSVVAARKSYTMIELGAGIGCWAVRAAYALQQYNRKLPYRLIAVEAEPTHFEWMHQHFTDNGIDPNQHSLIHAAVSQAPGEVSFYVGSESGDVNPGGWYGQELTKDYEVDILVEEAPYGKYRIRRHASGAKSIYVPAITLVSILDDLQQVDLIHVDIQGLELSIIGSSIDELDAKVKRLHVGTHSREIENGLRQLLTSHGWRCLADYPSASVEQTPWGPIEFQDGIQSWVNPRRSRPWWLPFAFISPERERPHPRRVSG